MLYSGKIKKNYIKKAVSSKQTNKQTKEHGCSKFLNAKVHMKEYVVAVMSGKVIWEKYETENTAV